MYPSFYWLPLPTPSRLVLPLLLVPNVGGPVYSGVVVVVAGIVLVVFISEIVYVFVKFRIFHHKTYILNLLSYSGHPLRLLLSCSRL